MPLPPPAANPPRPAPDTEFPVRPKVLRRPAQFSGAATTVAVGEAAASLPAVIEETPSVRPPSPGRQPWHEDGRFGLALVVMILLVNLGLMAWLPHLGHRSVPGDPAPLIARSTPADRPASITLYAPADAMEEAEPRPAVHVLDAPAGEIEIRLPPATAETH